MFPLSNAYSTIIKRVRGKPVLEQTRNNLFFGWFGIIFYTLGHAISGWKNGIAYNEEPAGADGSEPAVMET